MYCVSNTYACCTLLHSCENYKNYCLYYVLDHASRVFHDSYSIGFLWIDSKICHYRKIGQQNSRGEWLLFHDCDAANIYGKYFNFFFFLRYFKSVCNNLFGILFSWRRIQIYTRIPNVIFHKYSSIY